MSARNRLSAAAVMALCGFSAFDVLVPAGALSDVRVSRRPAAAPVRPVRSAAASPVRRDLRAPAAAR